MSEYTPSVEQGERAYIDGLSGTSRTREESAAEYRRMIEEVERAAAEKAWDEGNTEGARGQRDFHLCQQGRITEAEYERREQARPNPYRRNEGENGAESG